MEKRIRLIDTCWDIHIETLLPEHGYAFKSYIWCLRFYKSTKQFKIWAKIIIAENDATFTGILHLFDKGFLGVGLFFARFSLDFKKSSLLIIRSFRGSLSWLFYLLT